MTNPSILVFGDPHLTLTPPEGRTDTYAAEVDSLFGQLRDIATAQQVLAVADTGDVFHRKGHTTHAEMVWAASHYKRLAACTASNQAMGALGNHDMVGNDPGGAYSQQPVGVLMASGCRTLLGPGAQVVRVPGTTSAILVLGLAYSRWVEASGWLETALSTLIEGACERMNAEGLYLQGAVVLVHTEEVRSSGRQMIRDKLQEFFGFTQLVIVNGHMHVAPGVYTHTHTDGIVCIEAGALMRTAWDQRDIQPSAFVISFPDGSRVPSVQQFQLQVDDPSLAFRTGPQAPVAMTAGTVHLQRFVAMLATGSAAVDAEGAVRAIGAARSDRQEIIDTAVQVLAANS